jgi:hypothetical protein
MSPRSIQYLEAGRTNAPVLSLLRLAEVLDVQPAALFEPSTHVRRSGRRPKKRQR